MKDDLQKNQSNYKNINSFSKQGNKPGLKSFPAHPDTLRPLQKKTDGQQESEDKEKTIQQKQKTTSSGNGSGPSNNLPPFLSTLPVQKKGKDTFEKTQLEPWTPSIVSQKKEGITSPGSSGNTGSKMPVNVQTKMESAFNTNFENVNIHQDNKASAINALAYTQGNDIHFASGQYDPGSQKGQELLGHELTHVVQQRQGRVQATTQAKGLPINNEPGLEKEADDMGKKAAQLKTANHAGNPPSSSSASTNIVQRAQESPTNYKHYWELIDMTVFELEKYATDQADWYASPHLNDNMRYWIRSILTFVREGNRLGGCSNLKVATLKDKMISTGEAVVLENLSHYCDAVSNSDPFEMSATNSVNKAFARGKNLKKLKNNFPAFVLKSAFKETLFNWVAENVPSWIDDLIHYYTTSQPKPIFQAHNGKDVDSYIDMKYEDSVDPISFNVSPLLGNIRNYHRFHKDALKALKKNFNDTSKSQPLTLILHSGLDHNGAFHRDPNLTSVITNNTMNTLMIEGKETLDEVKNEIGPLAKKYGKDDKIDQVMFAGHGDARSIELAGTIEEKDGKVKEKSDSISLSSNKAKSDELFDEILKNVNDQKDATKQKHRKAVFNACLTISNEVGFHTAKGETDQKKVKEAFEKELKNNMSLAGYLQDKANTAKKDFNVKGSNASFGQIKLIDSATGNLDLVSSDDPKLTASKLEYVEHGTEPVGALRAVAECWITDEKACFDAMTKKSAKPTKKWDEIIIKTCYDIILSKYKNDGVNINKFSHYNHFIAHAKEEHYSKPSFVGVLDNQGADILTIFNALKASEEWNKINYIPLTMYQNLMTHSPGDATLKDQFLTHLESKFNCHSARKFVDIEYLEKKGHLKDLLAKADSKGKLILGLLGVIGPTINAECKKYIETKVNAENEFDASLKINDLLAGASTENTVLINIGKKSAPVKNPSANVKAFGDKKNKVYVKPLTKKGTITKDPEAAAYTLPDKTSKALKNLAKNSDIQIIGEIDSWYGIEYKKGVERGTAFIEKTDVAIK